ncbi:carbohydrate deacetylase-like [Ciona intestinalis]
MKRLLIVADDFGYGYQRNRGIVECFLKQSISAASILVNCKHSEDAVNLALLHNLPLSLHFNITQGKPISDINKVRSLVGGDGMFLGKSASWKNTSYLQREIKLELSSQINWFESKFGRLPDRVDGHQHIHVHPMVRNAFAITLQERGIEHTRLPVEDICSILHHGMPQSRLRFHEQIQMESEIAALIFDRHCIKYTPHFIGLNFVGKTMNSNLLQRSLANIYKNNRNAICELMCHPGYRCDKNSDGFLHETSADDFSCSPDREHELKVLTSSAMAAFYKSENILLKYESSTPL